MATTYYIEAAGNDANAGTSAGAGNAWLTIDKAMNTVIAGDKVWVKSDKTYSETATIDTAGSTTASIVFEGYTTTTGDNGVVTWSGTTNALLDSVVAGTDLFYVFKNFHFTGHSGVGVLTDGQYTVWKNCRFTNGTTGLSCRDPSLWNCTFSGQSQVCLDMTGTSMQSALCVGCRFDGNTGWISSAGPNVICYACEFIGTSGVGISAGGMNIIAIFNCTFDGRNGASSVAVNETSSGLHRVAIVNTILHDFNVGWQSGVTRGADREIGSNVLVYSNGTNFSGVQTPDNLVTTNPTFTDLTNKVYTLQAGSPAIDTGLDRASVGMDIGANQTTGASCDYPAVGDVESGVVYNTGGSTGTLVVPAVGDVQTGVGYGAGGTEHTGTFDAPTVGNVKTGIGYGAGGAEFTGTRTHPVVADVESGVQYGAGGTEFTGTFTEPGVANVKSGVQYGGGGTEFTGTLAAGGGGAPSIRSGGQL